MPAAAPSSRSHSAANAAREAQRKARTRQRAEAVLAEVWDRALAPYVPRPEAVPLWTPDYTPHPWQERFHASRAPYTLGGGGAGPGKTEALLQHAVDFCRRHRGVHVAVFRRTYPELEASFIQRFRDRVPGGWYRFHSGQHLATFAETGSRLRFCHCEREGDVYAYQSAEFDQLLFDELTHFTEFIVRYLLSRLRATRPGVVPRLLAGTNPGNVGHSWVKRLWVDRDPETARGWQVDLEDFEFFPALAGDNPTLTERDPGYLARLRALPETERRALLYGDWESFSGQFFRAWRRGLHVVPPFAIPAHWPRVRAVDYGATAPLCCLWLARDPAYEHPARIYVYREWYAAGRQLSEHVRAILERSEGERYRADVADPSMFARTQERDGAPRVSLADQAAALGLRGLKPAFNDRLPGWQVVNELLAWPADDRGEPTGEPNLFVFDTCANLIRTLPAMVHDQRRVEDLDTAGEDHALDALRYGAVELVGLRTRTRPRMGASREDVLRGSAYGR